MFCEIKSFGCWWNLSQCIKTIFQNIHLLVLQAIYDTELQSYLKATGLHLSDLAKSRKKDQRDKQRPPPPYQTTSNHSYASLNTTIAAGATTTPTAVNIKSVLPHISQMWSGHSTQQTSSPDKQPDAAPRAAQILGGITSTIESNSRIVNCTDGSHILKG